MNTPVRNRKLTSLAWALLGTVVIATAFFPFAVGADDSFVYSVYKGVELGNAGEETQKDFYVNMGTNQGVKTGSILEVSRRTPTYDLSTEKLYKDVRFPFARLRVIHAEKDAAIARLEKLYPMDKTPVVVPRAVIVGDLVKPAD